MGKLTQLQNLYERYERRVSSVAFLAGFIWDSFTLSRIDLWLDNLIILTYLVIAGSGIILVNAYWSGSPRFRFLDPYARYLSLPIQFAFGGLFSGFFIFYSRSASLVTSWPFLLFLALLLVGNEFFRKRYFKVTFQTGVYFIAILSYSAFAIPVLWGRIGALAFLLSGAVGLATISGFLWILSRVSRARLKYSWRTALGTICSLYILFNILYFTNIIPPIPLSLKEIVVAHAVSRVNGTYEIKFEPPPRYLFFQDYSRAFHRVGDQPVYIYSAIFAPTDLQTKILHRWQRLDEKKNEWIEWIETDKFAYGITGGRDGGYRGFSLKKNLTEGKWRVDVITEQGQLIGRAKFWIEESDTPPELKTTIQ